MRPCHIIRKTNNAEYPNNCIWFDTETHQVKQPDGSIRHYLKFGYACYMRRNDKGEWDYEEWYRFERVSDFWFWVSGKCRSKSKLYLFCHNTSFDLPVLNVFSSLPAMGFELESAIIDAPPTILRYARAKQYLVILDTLNLFRMPLSYLGQEIGLSKLDMPEDNALGVTWDTYGKRDVEIIRDACLQWWKFLKDNNYGSFMPTLAGQAMRVYKQQYMRHEILIDNNERNLELTREGYYGARNECFRLGHYKGDFTLLDVNSMYPDVMATNPLPFRLVSHLQRETVQSLADIVQRYAVTARVIVHTDIPAYPKKHDGKLMFPVGRFECILSTPEIIYALERSHIKTVLECSVFEQDYLFKEMMNDLYQRRVTARERGDNVGAFLFRKIINSFYGKWGQSGGKWIEIGKCNDLEFSTETIYNVDTKKLVKIRHIGGLIQQVDDEMESRDSFPAIAGHITAYARMKLWNIIQTAGRDNVYYCDTDSVLVTRNGCDNLKSQINKSRMGFLSIKGEYHEASIYGCKDYVFGDVAKTKGVRSNALWLGPNIIEQVKWSGLRGLLRSNSCDAPITSVVTKHLKRQYTKGVVKKDGSVHPLVFPLRSR